MGSILKNSIYSPEFYRSLKEKKVSFSLKYYYTLALGLSLVLTVYYSFVFVPALSSFLREIGPQIIKNYPDELVVNIKDGKVSVNVTEPYRISFPEELKTIYEKLPAAPPEENLLVIDTKNQFTPERFEEYHAYVLLTKEMVAYREGKKGIKIEPLSQFPNVEITKKKVAALADNILSLRKFLAPLLVFGLFVFFILLFSLNLLWLFLGAFLVWAIARVKKVELGYTKAYQIGIHAITLSSLVETFLFVVQPIPKVPFLFTMIMIFVTIVNLRPVFKSQSPEIKTDSE